MEKLERVLRLCDECGVHTRPKLLVGGGAPGGGGGRGSGGGGGERGSAGDETTTAGAGVWVAPVLAWYHLSFDTEPDIEHTKARTSAHPTVE